MLLRYMRSHNNDWPDDWDDFQSSVESEPALFLRGRHPEEPDYMGRMRRTIKIDWSFDRKSPEPNACNEARWFAFACILERPKWYDLQGLGSPESQRTNEPSDKHGEGKVSGSAGIKPVLDRE